MACVIRKFGEKTCLQDYVNSRPLWRAAGVGVRYQKVIFNLVDVWILTIYLDTHTHTHARAHTVTHTLSMRPKDSPDQR